MVAGHRSDTNSIERFGRVVDAGGAPGPNASIVIVTGSVPMPEIALLSDNAGRFSVRLPQGVFMLRAHGLGGTGEVEVGDESADNEIVISIGH
jgi:hypothetical protein